MKSNISTFRGNQLYLDSSTTVDSVLKYIQDPFKNVRLTKALMVTCGLMIFQRFTGKEANITRVSFLKSFLVPLFQEQIHLDFML